MEEYKFLLDIAIILAMTKAFSLVSKKFNMPPVVGALIAGIILGPVVLNIVDPSDSILNLAEVGVVVLMFQAGLETDIDELKKSGIPAFVIALCGVLVPLVMGAALSLAYGRNMLESIFIGVILTATSVSITVEALQDMGHLKGRVGTAILGAAIIDDILGIVLLFNNDKSWRSIRISYSGNPDGFGKDGSIFCNFNYWRNRNQEVFPMVVYL